MAEAFIGMKVAVLLNSQATLQGIVSAVQGSQLTLDNGMSPAHFCARLFNRYFAFIFMFFTRCKELCASFVLVPVGNISLHEVFLLPPASNAR